MSLLLFIVSFIMLDIIGSVFYIGVLLLSFFAVGKVFKMNGDKWKSLFKLGKGTGFYFMMFFPYLVMLVVLFWASQMWFDMINFKHNFLGSLSVVTLLTLILLFKFPKIKDMVNNKYS
ncbi:hypothetical protein GCM10028778_25570 [Barrientosiimonas marina]